MTATRWSLLVALLVACRAAADGGLVNPQVRARYEAESVASLAFSPDAQLLASAGLDGTLRLWDPATGKEKARLATFKSGIYAVTFASEGKQVVAGGADGVIRLWDVAKGKVLGSLMGHTAAVTCLVGSPGGKTLISGSTDRTIRFWDLTTRKEVRKIAAHDEGVLSLGLTSDNLLLSTGEKQEVLGGGHFVVVGPDKPRLWDLATGKEMRSHSVEAGLAMLSYDRRFLATDGVETKLVGGSLSQRKLFALRDAATGRILTEFKTPMCYWIAFTPDGKLLASVDSEGCLRVWEAVTGQEVYRLSKWPGSSLAFSADGKRLAAGTGKGEVLFLSLPPEREKWQRQAKGADLPRLWNELGGADAAAAYRALWTLAAMPDRAVTLVKGRLKPPAASTDLGRTKQLIADLDRKQFSVREAATKALEKLGFEAEVPL
ncbi:MAG TPA: WD40 repeat domain-containing protein, partial [Gemmataceae bacterium]|nr:WD40 repeat domain-containing protein [Gemmataceae bacterium]